MLGMTVSIIIITLDRPDHLRRCLECVCAQHQKPAQVIVVDSSQDSRSSQVVALFPGTLYLRNESGIGRMTTSRNLGLRSATGSIIAFLDDDAFAHPNWLEELVSTFESRECGAVGGRALNNQPDEANIGVHQIGRLKANGTLTGNFAADPGHTIQVDHLIGCNMSFRREVIAQLGGFREDYPGISGVREDTDMCLRVSALGHRIWFNPRACVDHIGAPQIIGRRFDARYMFFAMQNHCVMLHRNFGWSSPMLLRFFGAAIAETAREGVRRIGGACLRVGAVVAGLACGIGRAAALSFHWDRSPIRTGPNAADLREWLSKPPVSAVGDATPSGHPDSGLTASVQIAPRTPNGETQTDG